MLLCLLGFHNIVLLIIHIPEGKKLKKMEEISSKQKVQKLSSKPAQAIWTLPSPAPSSPSHLHSTTQQWHIRDLETELTMWKEHCKQDNWVELHQNPSYKSINQGLAKWALATCESMHAIRVVNVEVKLG